MGDSLVSVKRPHPQTENLRTNWVPQTHVLHKGRPGGQRREPRDA